MDIRFVNLISKFYETKSQISGETAIIFDANTGKIIAHVKDGVAYNLSKFHIRSAVGRAINLRIMEIECISEKAAQDYIAKTKGLSDRATVESNRLSKIDQELIEELFTNTQ